MANPLDIASLESWYDVTAGPLLTTSGSFVTGLKNRKTGNVPELIQTNSARYPALATMGPNGHQALSFNGATPADYLFVQSNPLTLPQPLTVVFLGQIDSNLGVTQHQFVDSATNRLRVFVSASGNLVLDNSSSLTFGAWPVDGLPHAVMIEANGASSSIAIDNGVPVVGNAGATGMSGGLYIGANIGNTFGVYGRMADVMVFNALLTPQEKSDIWSFLARYTNLQGYRRNPESDGINKPVLTGGMN